VPVCPKRSLTEFAKWCAGMPNTCDPATISIYHRAIIAKTFPAYTLETARGANARDVFWAMELLDAAQKVKS
jgi:hypothetical protein